MVALVESAIVVLYLILVLGIGWYFKDRRSADDYWTAGGGIGTFVNTLAIFAAFGSGGTFLGAVGVAYALGTPYIWSAIIGSSLGFILAAILVAKPMRRVDEYTIADIFDFLYKDNRIIGLVGVLVVVGYLLYIVAQLKAAGLAAEYLLDIGYMPSVIIMGLIFVAYVAVGGMWAITFTDFIQGLLMWGVMLSIAAFSLAHFGFSVTAPLTETPRIYNMAPVPIESYVGFFVIWITSVAIFPHIVMRLLSAESPQSAKRSYAWVALLYAVFSIIAFYIVGSAAISLAPELANPDLALIAVMEQLLPSVVAGLTAAAILAAVMSTTDALLLAMSAAVANDLYGGVLNPDASEEKVVRIGTIATFVFGLLAIVGAALNPPNMLVSLYSDAMAMMASGFFIPMILGIWWKGATKIGALAGMTSGPLTYVILWPVLPTFAPILVSLPVCLIATVGGSVVTSPAADRLERITDKLGHGRVGW